MVTRLQFFIGILLLITVNNYSIDPTEEKRLYVVFQIIVFFLITYIEGRRK